MRRPHSIIPVRKPIINIWAETAKSQSTPPQGTASQSPTAASRFMMAKKMTAAASSEDMASSAEASGTRMMRHCIRPCTSQIAAVTRMKITR